MPRACNGTVMSERMPYARTASAPFRVLGRPRVEGCQVGFQHRPSTGQRRGSGRARDVERNDASDGPERVVFPNAAQGDAPHPRGRAGRLLAPRHGVQQVHGDEVGEPRNRHTRQLFGRLGNIQGRADPYPRLMKDVQPLTATSAVPASARSSVLSRRVATWPEGPPVGAVRLVLTATSRPRQGVPGP
ncbi:hypothetical protein LV779_34250 [Streptomyces thinghirensis]|nr:hypothetical protein [Streptomyces thinghirensis]